MNANWESHEEDIPMEDAEKVLKLFPAAKKEDIPMSHEAEKEDIPIEDVEPP